MYAIIKCGGKQYKVSQGDVLVVDQVKGEPGDKFDITDIIMLRDNEVKVNDFGKTKVTASIVEHFRGDKIIVFKYKAKKNYRRKNGHRSYLSKIKIEDIGSSTKKSSKKEEVKQEEVTA